MASSNARRTIPGSCGASSCGAIDDPDRFLAIAEWRTEEDYHAWQESYPRLLPPAELEAAAQALAEPPRSTTASIVSRVHVSESDDAAAQGAGS